jgi:hypothetical protein
VMKKFGLLFIVLIPLAFSTSCITKEVQQTETYYETGYRTENCIEIGQEHSEIIKPAWTRYAPMYFKSLDWAKEGAITSIDGYVLGTADALKSQVKLTLSRNTESSLWGIQIINLTGKGPILEPPQQSGLATRKLVEGEVKYIPQPGEQLWLDELNVLLTDPKHCLFLARSDEYTGTTIEFNATGVEKFAVLTCIPVHWLEPSGPVVEKVQLTSWEKVNGIRRVPYQTEQQRTVTQTRSVPFWEMWKSNPPEETQPSSSTTETAQSGPSTGIIYSDDFSNTDSGWPEKTTEKYAYHYDNGEYHLTVNQSAYSAWSYNENSESFDDFIIEADARPVTGGENSEYGLIFRCQDDDNFYYFTISSDGYYLAGKRLDGKWCALRRWTPCDSVARSFTSNHLKVVCKGSQMDLYVNDNMLATVLDDSFTSGYVGGMLCVPESGSGASVAFDNLKVYNVN